MEARNHTAADDGETDLRCTQLHAIAPYAFNNMAAFHTYCKPLSSVTTVMVKMRTSRAQAKNALAGAMTSGAKKATNTAMTAAHCKPILSLPNQSAPKWAPWASIQLRRPVMTSSRATTTVTIHGQSQPCWKPIGNRQIYTPHISTLST